MTRIAVFIDYQNLYHGARRAFPDPRSDSPSFGHVDPAALARLLTGLGRAVNPERILSSTSVYRGEPGRMSHPKLLTAFGRQARRWRADPSLTVKTIPTPEADWTPEPPGGWADVPSDADFALSRPG